MRVHIEAELVYYLAEPTDVLFAVEAIPMRDQRLIYDKLTVAGDATTLRSVEDHGTPGRRQWMETTGQTRISYVADVEVNRAPLSIAGLSVPPRRELPADVISYLFPSRYCESDRLEIYAAKEFDGVSGGDQILQMSNWIFEHFDYVPGSSDATTTATDSFLKRQGVCRDYAHVLISFARAVGVPARMVSVYAPGLNPPDFHAVVEVWLEGSWHLIDPSRMAPEESFVRITYGRDATDISFMTIFGQADLISQTVMVSADS
ncbi:MAG: transglutaminase [Ponticaulis sp.]|nr:transglutaminase [Ponticaulis sp.]|tara:strand:+ start:36944 stop:37726 length:783 start_codon:yes stop_codon:yes gene_type:complete